MTNHYKTATIVFIIILLGAYAIAELDTNDLDEVCSTNNNILKRISGTWQCDTKHYAEAYYHSYDNPVTVTITDNNTYYTITNFTTGNYNGFRIVSNGINTTKQGTYLASMQMAFQGGNNGDYEIEMFIGADAQPDCASFATGTGNAHTTVHATCIKNLSIGDILEVKIKDLGVPAQNIQYHQLNFNIHEVS